MFVMKDQLDVVVEHANPQDHELHTERNNQTIKNQARTGLNRTKHKTMSRIMMQHLVIASTDKFNAFPAKYGVSDHHSPTALVTRKVRNCDKDC